MYMVNLNETCLQTTECINLLLLPIGEEADILEKLSVFL